MSSERFYIIREKPAQGDVITLDADESRHLSRVVRARPGDEVTLLDGDGGVYRAAVKEISIGRDIEVSIEVFSAERALLRRPVDIAIPLMKAQRMDFAVEKCAEIGVRRIIPFTSERSIWKGGVSEARKKKERLERKAEAACKQSGNPWFTGIDEVTMFRELLDELGAWERVLFADSTGLPSGEIDRIQDVRILGIIGPEGGLSKAEICLLNDAGIERISLSDSRLRSETATVCLAWYMIQIS